MKVILEKVFRDEWTEGKFGKYRNVGIKVANEAITLEDGEEVTVTDKWIKAFQGERQYKEMDAWDAGMEVDITATKAVKGEAVYLNFKPLSRVDARLEALEAAVFGGKTVAKKSAPKAKKEEAEDLDW